MYIHINVVPWSRNSLYCPSVSLPDCRLTGRKSSMWARSVMISSHEEILFKRELFGKHFDMQAASHQCTGNYHIWVIQHQYWSILSSSNKFHDDTESDIAGTFLTPATLGPAIQSRYYITITTLLTPSHPSTNNSNSVSHPVTTCHIIKLLKCCCFLS